MAELNKKDDGYFSQREETSEIEMAMQIIRSLEGVVGLVKAQGEEKKKNIELEIAEEQVLTIKNKHVKKVVLSKIEEVKNLFDSHAER